MTFFAIKDESTNETWTYPEYCQALGTTYETDVSLRKVAGNVFFSHEFSELVKIDIAAGAQKSQSQRTGFLNFATSLSQINSESYYADTKIKYKNLYGQINIHSGEDINNYKFNSYKFTNLDGNIEYYKQFKSISIRPGISYKHSVYNSPITYEQPFSLSTLNYQFKDEQRIINSLGLFLLTEWRPSSKFRIIGAARLDKFSINDNYSMNFELAGTYRINKNNLVRYVVSRATRSPFVFDTYINSKMKFNMEITLPESGVIVDVPADLNIQAQKDLHYPAILNNEISWRYEMNNSLSFDLEVFYSRTNNLVVSNLYRKLYMTLRLTPTGEYDSIVSMYGHGDFLFENFDISAQQYGASLVINYKVSDKINTKIFGTYQKTLLFGKTEIEYETLGMTITEIPEENADEIVIESFTNPTIYSDNLTPTFYGGFFVDYLFSSKWNFSTDAYFYTKQRFIDYDFNNLMADYTGNYRYDYMDIETNIVWNAKARYQIKEYASVYLTVKNILGDHREYGYADQIGRSLIFGLEFNW